MVTKWPTRLHRDSGREKIPTELEITTATTGEEQISFGYDIPASSDPFRWFKLLLVEDQLPQRLELSDELAKAREKMEKANLDAVRVVAKYLRELWRHTTQEVKNILSENSVAECRFHIVVTVPALWKDAARQSMREAVEAAGLLVARRAGPTTLDLLSEPAAAAIATFASMQGRPDIVSGDSMLIVAAGSVTVELICYNVDSVDPFRLSECIEGSSGYCGAVFLDQNFQNHLRNRLTPQVWDAISAKDLKKFLNNEWEHGIKQAFDGLDEKSYTIDLPSSCEVEDDELTLEQYALPSTTLIAMAC
ncbi:hypothetical protein QBC43DRAFT_342044 [Cladorrhinum sp. PSN259]|nr:hypothetical protein QBC43DRAFT_342044 [Cladorrhinum sp. PSN259]